VQLNAIQQVPGKKYNMLACGFFQGAMAIAFGLYIDHNLKNGEKPSRELFVPTRVHGCKADRRQP
jgi:hypothetical protein